MTSLHPSIDAEKLDRLAEVAVKVGLQLQEGQDLVGDTRPEGDHEEQRGDADGPLREREARQGRQDFRHAFTPKGSSVHRTPRPKPRKR